MDVGSLVTRLLMDANQFDSTINKSQKEIAAFKSKVEGVGRGVNSVFNGITGTALKLVPAIAAGTTALGAFNKILKSSGSLSDSFDKIALQVGSSIDYIATRAAELDFHNAIDGLKESLKIAGQLADVLDRIGTTDTYKAYEDEVLNKLLDRQRRAREEYQLNPTKENEAKLNAATDAVRKQQIKVNNKFAEQLKNQNDKIGTLKYGIADKAGFAFDKRAIQIAEILAKDQNLLEISQARYKKFNDKKFKNPDLFIAKSGINILKDFSWEEINAKKYLKKEFIPFFEKTTGLKFTKHNYEEQKRFIPISNLEGLEKGGDLTELTKAFTERERLVAGNEAANAQIAREQRKSNNKVDRNNTKVNTKLTNTNETLEEINKKFEDAKALLSLQNKEGYLDKESYLKELLKTTDSYIDKLYDPLYANLEGVKELRSAAISAKDGILKQLKDLNKPRGGFNFGNTNFNLVNSNLYRQLERLMVSQLGSFYNGREGVALISEGKRSSIGYDIVKAKEGDYVLDLINDIIDLNKSEMLNYGNVLATILENDELISGKKASYIFQEAFEDQQEIYSGQVYDFLNAVRIMSSLPEEMAEEFRKLWTDLAKYPEKVYSLPTAQDPSIINTASVVALKSIPDAFKFVSDKRPINDIQNTRVDAMLNLNASLNDLDNFYKQNSPIQNIEDLKNTLSAFKDFNRLNDLDFFNNLDSKLTEIDKSLQSRIKKLKQDLLQLLDEKNNLEKQLKIGKLITTDEKGKEIVGRDLTEEEKTKLQNEAKAINGRIPSFKKYINELEEAQVAEQGLVQISQVFSIKQKEIKEKFDDFRSVTSSIGEITNAFSDLDGKVGEFAKTLGALNNFANIIANLVEKLELLNKAKKASAIADNVMAASTTASTAAILTNTAASGANAASNTVASTALTETAVAASTAAGGLFAAAAAAAAATAANVGEAASEGTKQASKLPFPANIAAIAAVLAAIGGAAATISSLSRKKYATGGIVTGPGSSFSDSIPISVSNGEMILNKSQQKNLFDLLNYGGGSSRGGGSSEVNFKILGENLVGSINNRNKGRNKIL